MRAKPNVFISPEVCMETLNNLYPYTGDISIDELVNSLRGSPLNKWQDSPHGYYPR